MDNLGPSHLLMRPKPVEYFDLKRQPNQLTFWPEEETMSRLSCPGEDYPWFYHERMQHYLANCVHPAMAAIMAQEDVEHKMAADERELKKLTPELWDVA